MLTNKTILITGGTGSFGTAFVKRLLSKHCLHKIIIYSRDEYKQYVMQKKFEELDTNEVLRFFVGDVRDKTRMHRAFEEVDYVVHAAALKQVPALEYNPTEAVKTNINGANNIIDVAIDTGIKKVISLSTDKAVNPVNLYGATKLVAEKLFVAANDYAGRRVKFSSVRYGNVVGSRGSVIPFFLGLKKKGIREFPVTDPDMTRFWITLDQAVDLVIFAINESDGGEIFVPKIPSMKMLDLAKSIDPHCSIKVLGIRPGEKIHEKLISIDEARATKIYKDTYVVLPQFFKGGLSSKKYDGFSSVGQTFEFTSDKNDNWLSPRQLNEIIEKLDYV
jgi:UDP-N-acetylglucosamine 4,6-dehydratase/5-epimerase